MPPLNPTLLSKACIQNKIKVDTDTGYISVHDALDNIGLFQSVCGQFKLIKVFCRKLRFLKTIVFFSLTIENPTSPMVDCKTIDLMAMVR